MKIEKMFEYISENVILSVNAWILVCTYLFSRNCEQCSGSLFFNFDDKLK